MNIKEAKETIQYTLQAYFQKDESGYPLVPLRQQRPILLIGQLRESERQQSWNRSPENVGQGW